MYKTPKIETMPVKPTGVICGSLAGPQNVGVNDNPVNNVEIF